MSEFSRRQFVKSSVVSAAAAGAAVAAPQQPSRGFHPASEAGRGVKIASGTAAGILPTAGMPSSLPSLSWRFRCMT